MVVTNGSDISNAFVNGEQVSTIYTNGEQVWPSYSRPYYIRWSPSKISSGTFSMNGRTYHFSHYKGEFNFSTGIITESAFKSSPITKLDTNAFSINDRAFANCESLTSVNISYCGYIGSYAFWSGTHPAVFDLYIPVCSYIGSWAFSGKYPHQGMVSNLYCPNCEYIDVGAFNGCGLNSLDLPKCSYIGGVAFEDNPISVVHLSVCEFIGVQAFEQTGYNYMSGCLRQVYIYTSSVCRLADSRVFGYFSTTGGSTRWYELGDFYVPSSLVSAYKSAQYWSEKSNRIHSIPN